MYLPLPNDFWIGFFDQGTMVEHLGSESRRTLLPARASRCSDAHSDLAETVLLHVPRNRSN